MSERIQPGDFYEDCRFHPMLCVSAHADDDLVGISLVNGFMGSCSPTHCGVVPLTFPEAVARKVWFNRLAERMGWPNPVPRDGSTDQMADEGDVALPDAWREMYQRGPDAVT